MNNNEEQQREQFIIQLQNELKQMDAIENNSTITNDYLLSSYDVIGFDVDYTLSIYDHGNMIKLLYESFTKYLIVNKGYPGNEYDYSTHQDFIIKMAKCEIIIDISNGNALQLNHNKVITKAYHGTKLLSSTEILLHYPNHIYDPFDFGTHYKENIYYYTKNNFEIHQIGLFLISVDLYDMNKLPDTVDSYRSIFGHIYEALLFSFKMNEPHQDCKTVGYFFPMFIEEPKKYFCRDYDSRDLIKKLKAKGKKLFFTTNSYFSFSDVVLRNSIGDDYAELFDLCIFNGKKPGFFKEEFDENGIEKVSCMFYDKTIINEINDEVFDKIINDKKENIILGGSYKIIEEFFGKLLGKNKDRSDIKYLFVGDDLFGDCIPPTKLKGWSSVFIFDMLNSGKIKNEPKLFRNGWLLTEDSDNQENKDNIENKNVGNTFIRKDIKSTILKENHILMLSNVEGIINLI